MSKQEGFQPLREEPIAELRALARLYRHEKTGAQILCLTNDDENKVFGITFPTPPKDATGVAHILEHSVLCGSRKYPVKEPFVELLKGSLHTFLNAFTYPDRTCYPVASQNSKDFYNLVDVYLDAVFHPLLNPHTFEQEGWHYELPDPDAPLKYQGVVFNEMKGVYSSPENLVGQLSLQSLFPDTVYGMDAGGDPRHIPELTYEQLRLFHQTHYHPSRARVFFYGDGDPWEGLSLLDSYFKEFEPLGEAEEIPPQPRFDKPRTILRPFGVGEEGTPRGMVTVNWLLGEKQRAEERIALYVLEYILLGMPGSPLRKALIDSGLGEDLVGEGLGSELREAYFSTGLKGIRVEDAGRVERLVLDTLRNLCDKGVDPLTTEAALNTVEFRFRENNTGSLPRGLVLMLRALCTWLYGGDPLSLVAFEAPLRGLGVEIRSDRRYFETLIEREFLENPHRTRVVLRPEPGLKEREAAEEEKRLASVRKSLNGTRVSGLVERTRQLRRIQETPDSPEALATIPHLSIQDLEPKIRVVPHFHLSRAGCPVTIHDLFTQGIVYLDLGLDCRVLPEELLPYLPLFGRGLLEMGTQKEDTVRLTQRISRKTGGIRSHTVCATQEDRGWPSTWLFLRGKAMLDRGPALVEILRDVLLETRWENQERFAQMVREEKARFEQMALRRGHQLINQRIRAHFALSHWAAEKMGGISQLLFIRELAQRVESRWEEVLDALQEIQRRLVRAEKMIVNVTLEEKEVHVFLGHLDMLLEGLPREEGDYEPWRHTLPAREEGFGIPSQVNYVGKGLNLYGQGYRFHGSALAIARHLRNGFLWDRIRVQGGAYGAYCTLDRPTGTLTLLSYRDPNLLRTLEVFDEAALFLEKEALSEKELTKAIIGAVGDMDAPQLPDAKGFSSLIRHLVGDTDDKRQRRRDELLASRAADFRRFGQFLGAMAKQGIVKVMGPRREVEGLRERLPGVRILPLL